MGSVACNLHQLVLERILCVVEIDLLEAALCKSLPNGVESGSNALLSLTNVVESGSNALIKAARS